MKEPKSRRELPDAKLVSLRGGCYCQLTPNPFLFVHLPGIFRMAANPTKRLQEDTQKRGEGNTKQQKTKTKLTLSICEANFCGHAWKKITAGRPTFSFWCD